MSNPAMESVRWGIIGCGNVTEVKSGPALQKVPGSELVAVMRRDALKAADYAKRHNVAKWYSDAQALVNDPAVNAVYVATPPSTHELYTIMAARAGKPVYVEKPMGRDTAECARMIDACNQAGVPLFVAYYRRCLPRFVEVKRLIDSGAIGTVRTVAVNLWRPTGAGTAGWRVDPETAGGGLFVDLAAHTLDLLDHLLGPITDAHGTAVNAAGAYKAEDSVVGHFRFTNGALGTGSWCFAAGLSRDTVDIVGSAGSIRFASFDESPITLTTPTGEEHFTIPHPPHVQQPLIETVVANLLGRLATCPSTGQSAMRTNAVMDNLLASWRTKQNEPEASATVPRL